MPPESETQLLQAVANGDTAAFSKLFKQFYPRVYRTVYGLLANETDAREVTQTVWIKAWQRRSHYNFKSSYSTWLHRIAVNTALDELRRRRRYWTRFREMLAGDTAPAAVDPLSTENATPVAAAIQTENHQALYQAIARLPENQRTVLVLKEFENYTYEEIANTLHCKVGTVMSRLHHARHKLSHFLNPKSP